MQVKLSKSSVEAFLFRNQIWGKTLYMYIHSDFEKLLMQFCRYSVLRGKMEELWIPLLIYPGFYFVHLSNHIAFLL